MTDFDPAAWPRKLNLGCGFDRRQGYVNVDLHDFHQPDLVADIRSLPMLSSGYYDEILAIDVLEHLQRQEGPPALLEWGRLLKDGGTLQLRVPNILGVARLLLDSADDLDQQRTLVQCLFGTQAYNGDFHHNGYTEMLLRDDLRVAGFDCVSFDSRDDWLFDVVAVKASQPKATRLADCRFMDLRRPSQVLAEPNSLAGLQARLRPTASRAKHLARGLRRRLDRLGRGDGADHDHRR